jgi:crotonobetainyl-CoA:carnitine CoA-transferase CaiB-like acyl-CoA transferase
LVALLADRLRERSVDAWLKLLGAAGVPVGKVRGVVEAFASAEGTGRRATVSVPHPMASDLRLVASPIRLTSATMRDPEPPPLLGEHTAEVTAELGLSAEP